MKLRRDGFAKGDVKIAIRLGSDRQVPRVEWQVRLRSLQTIDATQVRPVTGRVRDVIRQLLHVQIVR